MMMLRADLRDPLHQVGQALGMARHERDAHALDALCDRSTSSRGCSTADRPGLGVGQRIAGGQRPHRLWPLLRQAWARVEPLARARNLKRASPAQGPKSQLAAIYAANPGCCACSSMPGGGHPRRTARRHARHRAPPDGAARWSCCATAAPSSPRAGTTPMESGAPPRTPASERGAPRLARPDRPEAVPADRRPARRPAARGRTTTASATS